MAFDMTRIREHIRKISQQMEDLWITQEYFRGLLMSHGLSPDSIAKIEQEAKNDPRLRELAATQFSAVRKFLHDSAWDAATEDFLEEPPSNDKPS